MATASVTSAKPTSANHRSDVSWKGSGRRRLLLGLIGGLLIAPATQASAQAINPERLPGVVVDDTAAETTGQWKPSTHASPFIGKGYIHDENAGKGNKSVRFSAKLNKDGTYHVLLGYTPGGNRARNVPVTIHTADGVQSVEVNQSQPPELGRVLHSLGSFRFRGDKAAVVVVSTAGTKNHVIADSIVFATKKQLAQLKGTLKTLVAKQKPKNKAGNKKPKAEPAPKFVRVSPKRKVETLTSGRLNAVLKQQWGTNGELPVVDDDVFLRRATLDLLGRQPTVEELQRFLADDSPDKRSAVIERLLASPEFGRNQANYWSDVIAYRQQEPELTFHDYGPFEEWLAGEFNAGTHWDEIVYKMLTARGKIKDNPAGTFIGFHQANPNKLAGETTRVFLGVQIHCAQCHDHPFVDMPQETFHGMAAFFARTTAKIPQRDSDGIEIKSKTKGEHRMPGSKRLMQPVVFDNEFDHEPQKVGIGDMPRRVALARWMVSPENPYFARAYVNRVWDLLMGKGFYDPVDDMGELALPTWPELHQRITGHFIAHKHDPRSVYRLIMNTAAYQRPLKVTAELRQKPFAAATAQPLRGDQVFDSLVTALGLPNVTPPRQKKTAAVRFPPPPKSTRDLVDEAFGYDPSFSDGNIVRTMKQAMFLMNNTQLQQQIDASPESGTFLAQLLKRETEDRKVVTRLYQAVLARNPSAKEMEILLGHLKQVGDREAAFEDILWSLVNSTEFTTRR